MSTKQLPQSLETEQALLGSILMNPSILDKVTEKINADAFYNAANKEIFSVIMSLSADNHPIDMITVMNKLNSKGSLEAVGGLDYITKLTELATTPGTADYYIDILQEKATLRALILSSQNISDKAYSGEVSATELVDAAEKSIFNISLQRSKKDYLTFDDIMVQTYLDIEKAAQNSGEMTGIPSGFTDIDAKTAGFQRQDLILLACRPSMGKTSLALSMTINMAIGKRIPVGFFSLEMSAKQIMQRIISMQSMIPLQKIRMGSFSSEAEWQELNNAIAVMDGTPLYIDETAALTMTELRSKARKMKIEHDIQVIFVDYLGYIAGSGNEDNRQLEVAQISRDLKNLAKELDIPVIACAQLSRAPETRKTSDHRPMLSDLRDSGSIEQDADLVMFIYRDEYYNRDSEDKGIAEIIIAKHRNGATGPVKLAWLAEYAKFANLKK